MYPRNGPHKPLQSPDPPAGRPEVATRIQAPGCPGKARSHPCGSIRHSGAAGFPGERHERHLFPDIPAWRYPEIAPRGRALGAKHGLPYNTGRLAEQYANVIAEVRRLGGLPRVVTARGAQRPAVAEQLDFALARLPPGHRVFAAASRLRRARIEGAKR